MNVATSQEQAQAVAETLLENRSEWFEQLVGNPDSFRDVEREVDQQVRTAGGQFVAALLQEVSETPALQAHVGRVRLQAAVPTKAPRVGRSRFRLLCGVVLYVTTLYCPPKPSSRKDPGRADAEQRTGLFPELAAFGIGIGCTPAMMETVARTVAINPSIDVARRELAQQGIRLDKKTVRRIAVQFGEQLLAAAWKR